jgi:TonB-dependent starch-binding outer membrane protein SusC
MKKQLLIKSALALFMLVLSVGAWAQQGTAVSGTIISGEDNSALPMATVQVKGTNQGTVSDINGKYYLQNVPAGATLVFSYVGMVSQEIPLGASTVIDVTLQPDVQQLEKVVVIGYGSARRSQVVGSVSRVSNDEITKQPVMNAVQGLQGKTAGVQIISSGEPGKQSEVRIRGTNSITAGANPIYVVDGVIVTDISNINTNDVESMEVLKDAASQAIYGSRAANGVILVTTKAGKMGKMRIAFDAYVGVRSMTSKVEMADARTYAQFTNEARAYDNQVPMFDVDTLKYDTDWFDAITRKGTVQNYSMNISGGTEKTSYYFSADYFSDEGILEGNYYNRFVLRNSNDYRINKYVTFGHTVNFTYAYNNIKPNVFTDAYRIGSTAPVTNPDGTYGYVTGLSVSNPVAAIDYTNHYTKEYRLQGNAYLELKPIEGLSLKSSINFNRPELKGTDYIPLYYVSSTQQTSNSTLNIDNNYSLFYIFDNNATYTNTFAEKHEVKLTVGYSAEHDKGSSAGGSRQDVPDQSNLWYLDQGDPNSATNYSNGYIKQRASFYSRLTYTFGNKYNVSGVLRRDGSSLFPPEQKWGTFYSVGASWILSREGFIENLNIFDALKIRGSYGKIGNDNLADATIGVLTPVTITGGYNFGGNGIPVAQGITLDQIKDASITWEPTTGIDVGLEFGVLKNRLEGEIGWYSKLTNAYVPVKLNSAAGDADQQVISQAADVRNKGVEIVMNWKQNFSNSLNYHVGFNITFNHNNVEDVRGGLQLKDGGLGNGNITTYTVEGQPIGSFWVYKTEGIYQSTDEINSTPHLTGTKPGDLILADVNGDNTLNELDRIFVGSYQPKTYYGINLGVGWKNIDLSVDCYGNAGNKIFNGKKAVRFGNDNIEQARADNRWTPDNLDGTQPRASNAIPAPSTYFVESGDFFRINNVTLGYTFNSENWGTGISRLRLFASAQNPLIAKKYSGFTPELPGSATSSGIELGIYPVFSTYMVGVNLTF